MWIWLLLTLLCSIFVKKHYFDRSKEISANAFYGLENVDNLVLPPGLTDIYSGAFYNLNLIKSYNIPSTVKSIGDYVFYNNLSLEEISIPSSVNRIGNYAFYDTDLTKLILPNNLEIIGDYAFYNNKRITNLLLPNGLEQIGEFAFENLSLTELIIPDSVQLIKEGALKGVNGLVSITLPFAGRTRTSQSKVSSYWDDGIDIYKFGYIFGQTRLRGKHLTTENLVYQGDIDGYGFGYYLHYYVPSSLRNITLTDQKEISANAFYGLTDVQKITLPSKVTNIYSGAFQASTNTTLYIYSSSTISYATNWNPNNRPIIWI
ncbi:MAG: leucine-rich repeat protein [Bacilli bacterium]